MQATGKQLHPLTNDYMFKALLQKNKNVLKERETALVKLERSEQGSEQQAQIIDQLRQRKGPCIALVTVLETVINLFIIALFSDLS